MKFVDASVFVHAFIQPKRELKPHEERIKRSARQIVKRIDAGEEVVISTVHLSEIANILEDFMPLNNALEIISSLVSKPTIMVLNVTGRDCVKALLTAQTNAIGFSDSIAYVLMSDRNIQEIYSFDKDFENIKGIKRINA
jgi:predicted nucleic acid-binding protein